MQTSDLVIHELKPFGAEISGIDLHQELPASVHDQLRDAWAKYGVLVFRQKGLTDDDLDRTARIFGDFSYAGIKEVTATAHRQFISNVVKGSDVGDGELRFHIGYSFAEDPLRATMLYGDVVPPPGSGGDTLFADAKLAYEALPPELRAKVDALKITHTKPQDKTFTWTHPIAFKHPVTRETVLFCSPRHFTRIEGMSDVEGKAFCEELAAFIQDPSRIYAHVWHEGDLVLYDNIRLQHARTNFDKKYQRHLKRRQMGPRTSRN